MHVLVVGANGQLGTRLCRDLLERGHEVRGSVRTPDRGAWLVEAGGSSVLLDLAGDDPDAFAAALDGIEGVLMPANPVVPRRGDDAARVSAGMERLVDAAASAGVRRFVLPSLPSSPVDESVAPVRARRRLEEQLAQAAMEGVTVRFPPFSDVWLALPGSSIPLRGAENATLDRPSPFLERFRRLTGALVEERGLMLVNGSASARNAFITVADASAALVAALEAPQPPAPVVEVGGPQVLTWRQVAEVYADVLGRPVRVVSTPGMVFGVLSTVLAPVAPVPSATFGMNRYQTFTETPWPPAGGLVDPDSMTTVREFLTAKAALPANA
jgi:uncharacterized protein YbjT (DUF2867 family)